MKRAAVLVSALAVVLYTVGISAQAKPNFAGKWTMEAPAAPAGGAAPAAGGGGGGGRGGGRGGGGFVSGMEVTITQDASMLKVDKTQGQNAISLTVKLDGSDSVNKYTGGRGEVTQTSKAAWDGAKLKITTTQDMGAGPTTSTQTLSMDGGMLVVESTGMGRDGTPTTTTAKYKKG